MPMGWHPPRPGRGWSLGQAPGRPALEDWRLGRPGWVALTVTVVNIHLLFAPASCRTFRQLFVMQYSPGQSCKSDVDYLTSRNHPAPVVWPLLLPAALLLSKGVTHNGQ